MMTPENKDRLQKFSTLLGAFVILFPMGIMYLYGNLSVYIYSYYHSKSNNKNDQIETPWLLAIYRISQCYGMIAAAFIEKRLGCRVTLSLGMLLFNVGVFTSFFALDVDISLMNFTLGLIAGLGKGLTYSMALQFVVDWFGASRMGLAFSSVLGSSALGSIASNQIITQYINPNNLKPNEFVGPTWYFNQRDIITRVPKVFLFYGIACSCLIVVGFCLIRKKATTNSYNNVMKDIENSTNPAREWPDEESKLLNKMSNIKPPSNQEYATASLVVMDRQQDPSLMLENVNDTLTAQDSPNTIIPEGNADIANDNINEPCSISPKEMLKMKSFYVMWFTRLLVEIAYFVTANYYKLFGQAWIKNDHFLTDVGTASIFFVSIVRILSGILVDRIGFKMTMIAFCGVNSVAFSLYYFTPGLNQWLYLIGTIMIYSISACLPSCFPAGVVKAFGKKHFSLNMSIIFTTLIISNACVPPVIQWLLSQYGWLDIFILVAIVNFIVLLLMFLLKNC